MSNEQDTETFLIVDDSGNVLDSVSGPHQYPYPFNVAVSRAQKFAKDHGNLLYIDDDKGRRWGRLERLSDACWSYNPEGKKS